MSKATIPVTVLTGYLGAGKTTLLNHLLTNPGGRRYGVIVNEFGEIGIDGDLIVGADEAVIELNNGCLCCSVRGDLIGALQELINRGRPLDAILIETTGLAEPAPIAATFFLDDDLSDCVRLDAVVTVVDALHLKAEIDADPIASRQIAFADVVLLNKTDLVSPDEAAGVEAAIRRLNPGAALHRVSRGFVDTNLLFERHAFDIRSGDRLEHAGHEHTHAHDVGSVSIATQRLVDPDRFMAWISELLRREGREILRSKGILAFSGEHRRFVFQGVQTMLDGDVLQPWAAGETRESRLVFIGRNLDGRRLRAEFEACLLPEAAANAA